MANDPQVVIGQPLPNVKAETESAENLIRMLNEAAALGFHLVPSPAWLRNYSGEQKSEIAMALRSAAEVISDYVDWNKVEFGTQFANVFDELHRLAESLEMSDEPIQEMFTPTVADEVESPAGSGSSTISEEHRFDPDNHRYRYGQTVGSGNS